MNAPNRSTLDSQVASFKTTKSNLIEDQQDFYTWVNAQTLPYLQNGINFLNILAGGAGYIDTSTTITVNVPTGIPNAPAQVQAVAIPSFGLDTVSVASGGSGYVVGNVLHVVGGTGGTVTVATLSGSAVATVTVTAAGFGYLTATGSATTGGAGTGCTITILTLTIAGQFQVLQMSLVGSGYGNTVAPSTANNLIQVNDSGGGLGAVLVAVLGNTDNALNYTPSGAALLTSIALDMQNDSLVTQGLAQSGAELNGLTLVAPGTGYAANDVLFVGTNGGKVKVLTVTGGAVATYTLTFAGSSGGYGYITGVTLASTGGAGTGATWLITALFGQIENNQAGYNSMLNLTTGSGLGI